MEQYPVCCLKRLGNCSLILSNENEAIISQIKWLEYMKVETDRMADLINSLLSLAKIENENAEVNKALFNMSEKVCKILW